MELTDTRTVIRRSRHSSMMPQPLRHYHRSYIILAFILAITVQCGYAHVALTFPPARYPALDFLDNARTKGPCGVPKPAIGKGTYVHGPTHAFVYQNANHIVSLQSSRVEV